MKQEISDNKQVSVSKTGGKVKQQVYPVFSTVVAADKGGMGSGAGKNPKRVLGEEPFYPGLGNKDFNKM